MTSDALVAGVVETVRVAVPAVAPVMLTGVVEPKLNVGRYSAPVGLDVIAAVSAAWLLSTELYGRNRTWILSAA